MNKAVSIARSEYSCGLPRAPVLAGCHAANASSVNQIVYHRVGVRPCYIRGSWSLCNALFQSCDGGSDCVCTALALLQVKSPQIMPDRPPSAWKIDLFNNAT